MMAPDENDSARALAAELGLDFDEAGDDDEDDPTGDLGAESHEPEHDPAFMEVSNDFGNAQGEHLGDHFGEMDAEARSDEEESASQASSPSRNASAPSATTPTPRSRTVNGTTPKSLFRGSPAPPSPTVAIPEAQDPMEVLAQELASTDAFISSLRVLDHDSSPSYNTTTFNTSTTASTSIPHRRDPSSSSTTNAPPFTAASSEPTIERYTTRMIRQLNDSARERETQLRELVSIEKEFRRIGGEVGGEGVLGGLGALDEDEEGLFDSADEEGVRMETKSRPVEGHLQPLSGIREDLDDSEEEVDPLRDDDDDDERYHDHDEHDDDEDEDEEDVFGEPPSPSTHRSSRRRGGGPRSRTKQSDSTLPVPPPPHKPGLPITPSTALPHLSYMRALTSSLVSSLSSLSEYAQENGAASADAGRKIKSLKARMGSLRGEWEGAEKSRVRVEEWEGEKRVDGRAIVKEQLDAFEKALAEAAVKTQTIMAA